MRRTKCPAKQNASDKNDKLTDCDEKHELPIKAASNNSPLEFNSVQYISTCVKDSLCVDGMQLFLDDKQDQKNLQTSSNLE